MEYRKTKDQQWMDELYNRYIHLIFTNCMSWLRDEQKSKAASIEIYEKLCHTLKTMEVSNFEAWLFFICKNHCLNILRSEKRQQKKANDFKKLQEDNYNVYQEEDRVWSTFQEEYPSYETHLAKAMNLIKKEQSICLELFYFEKLTYKEIAAQLQISTTEVKSRLQNGRRKLKLKIMELQKAASDEHDIH